MNTFDIIELYRPITPDMADGWHELIMPEIPQRHAIGFTTLVNRVYDRLLQSHYNGADPTTLPSGNVTNAILAIAQEDGLILGESTIRRGQIG